jgi:hypothetical protein
MVENPYVYTNKLFINVWRVAELGIWRLDLVQIAIGMESGNSGSNNSC